MRFFCAYLVCVHHAYTCVCVLVFIEQTEWVCVVELHGRVVYGWENFLVISLASDHLLFYIDQLSIQRVIL